MKEYRIKKIGRSKRDGGSSKGMREKEMEQ